VTTQETSIPVMRLTLVVEDPIAIKLILPQAIPLKMDFKTQEPQTHPKVALEKKEQ